MKRETESDHKGLHAVIASPSPPTARTARLDKVTRVVSARLRRSVNRLNAQARRVGPDIRAIEAALGAAAPGVDVWRVSRYCGWREDPCPRCDVPIGEVYDAEYLGYAKRNGHWGLYVADRKVRQLPDGEVEILEETNVRLLHDADSAAKLHAIYQIEPLISDMAEGLEGAAESVKRRLDEVGVP